MPGRPRHGSAHVEPGDATLLVLDRTVFYPGGGGQPSDRGAVVRDRRRALVDGPRREEGRWRDRPRARAGRRRPTGGRRRGPGRPRLGASSRADADPHRAPCPVRGRLARPRRPRHGRQHGAWRGTHGLRVREHERRARRRHRGGRQRRAGRRARGARERPAAGRGLRHPRPHPDEDQPAARGYRGDPARSRSSGSTCRPTAARTSPTRARWAASGSPATNRRAGSTSASGSSSSTRSSTPDGGHADHPGHSSDRGGRRRRTTVVRTGARGSAEESRRAPGHPARRACCGRSSSVAATTTTCSCSSRPAAVSTGRRLRAHLGVRRLTLPDADEAREVTGYERYTITPFGSTRAWPVILDASAMEFERVSVGGGALRGQPPPGPGRPRPALRRRRRGRLDSRSPRRRLTVHGASTSPPQLDLVGRLAARGRPSAAVIGIEREIHDHPAGMRTHLLVALGSALFTVLSIVGFPTADGTATDPSRVAAQIVTGIGFLGAGRDPQVRPVGSRPDDRRQPVGGRRDRAWPPAPACRSWRWRRRSSSLVSLWPLRLLSERIESATPGRLHVGVQVSDAARVADLFDWLAERHVDVVHFDSERDDDGRHSRSTSSSRSPATMRPGSASPSDLGALDWVTLDDCRRSPE